MAGNHIKLSDKPANATIAAGIDVHKYKLQVFVLGRFGRENKPLGEQTFGNDSTGRKELCKYLQSYYPDEIVMEKTGKLSTPVEKSLNEYRGWKKDIPRVAVVAPETIKRFAGEKHTDPNSAFQLARLGISGLLNVMRIPAEISQRLKSLTRESEKYTTQSTRIINIMKDMLSGLGYTLPDFTLTSTWGLALLKLLLVDGIDGDIAKVYELLEAGHVDIHSSSKKALVDRKARYLKYTYLSLTPFDKRSLQRQLVALEMVEALKASNLKQIEDTVNETPLLKRRVQAIENIGCISAMSAAAIIAEVDDIERFGSWKQFALYAGRAIAPDESGQYVGKPHMTKRCNHHLKDIFKQAGRVACFNLEADSDIRRYALRQLGKHPREKGIACANTSAKIVRIVYKILHDEVPFDPFHDTAKKLGQTSPASTDPKKEKSFRLKEARKRANRFRKLVRRTLEELAPGEMKTMLTHVLELLDKNLDRKGVNK
jgi:transposase